jgi:hypothetical protein
MKEVTVSTIHWSKYLDVTKNPRVKNFLKYRGDDVMWQVALNVHKSGRGGKNDRERLVMIVHENAPYAIHIPESEYLDVLDLTIRYFQDKEEYEKCATIVKFKQDILQKPKQKRKLQEQKMI